MSRKTAREIRKRRRWMIRQGVREEMIELRDKCGIKDPTPYEAVKHMVKQQKIAQVC